MMLYIKQQQCECCYSVAPSTKLVEDHMGMIACSEILEYLDLCGTEGKWKVSILPHEDNGIPADLFWEANDQVLVAYSHDDNRSLSLKGEAALVDFFNEVTKDTTNYLTMKAYEGWPS